MADGTMLCARCWGRSGPAVCDMCRGTGVVSDRELSPHFRLSECLASETALRRGIVNDPPVVVVEHLRESAGMLWEPVRALLGVPLHVNSGYRSPALNAAVKGSRMSAHVSGYALDCVPVGISVEGAMRRVAASALHFDQAICEFGSWLHLGWKGPGGAQRREALMIFDPRKYLPWNPDDRRVCGGAS